MNLYPICLTFSRSHVPASWILLILHFIHLLVCVFLSFGKRNDQQQQDHHVLQTFIEEMQRKVNNWELPKPKTFSNRMLIHRGGSTEESRRREIAGSIQSSRNIPTNGSWDWEWTENGNFHSFYRKWNLFFGWRGFVVVYLNQQILIYLCEQLERRS